MDWHSDSLRAGRFGVLTPAGVIFSPPFETGSGACRVSCTAGTGTFSRGQSGRGVGLTILPYLPPSLTKRYSYTPTPPLCIHGMLQSKIRRLPTSSAFCCTKEWELQVLLQLPCVNRALPGRFFLPSLQNAVYILNGVVSTRTLRPGHHRWYSCATVPPFALLKRYTKRTLLNCIRATHLHAVALLYIKMWYMLRRNTQTKNWTITAFHLPHYHSLPPTHLVVSILSSCDLYGYFCSK